MTIIKILVFLLLFAFSKGLYTPEQGYDKQIAYQVQYISKKFKINIEIAQEIVKEISDVSSVTKIAPSLYYAIIHKESSFNVNAINDSGRAKCLMQVHTSSGYTLLENSISHCLITASRILLDYYAKSGSIDKALSHYFCGSKIENNACKAYSKKVRYLQVQYKGWI